jgi:hypothetical protein
MAVNILDEDQNGSQDYEETDWSSIFGAPDFTTLIKKPKTARARDYEKRTNSALKAGLVTSLNTGNYADAAAILKLGPAFSTATGELADANERARGYIDLLTQPSNPVVMFALTAVPLIAQLMRNHEATLAEIPSNMQNRKARRASRKANKEGTPPRVQFTIPLIKKRVALRFGLHIRLGKVLSGFRSQTVHPEHLAQQVFTDPKVIDALRKMGAVIHEPNQEWQMCSR